MIIKNSNPISLVKILLLSIFIISIFLNNCNKQKRQETYIPPRENDKYGTLIDPRDGQEYKTIKIGKQIWMAENLNYGRVVQDCKQTQNGIIEKTYYNNDPEMGEKYGALYTWKEANLETGKNGGLAPPGWHIPSLKEWRELKQFLGDSSGQKLKASQSDSIPWDGTNESGFTAIASGESYQKYFGREGQWAMYWTATEQNDEFAWFAQLDGFWYPEPPKYIKLYLGNYYIKENAFSVRCVKDNSSEGENQ